MGVQKAFKEIRTFMLPPPSGKVRKGDEAKQLRVSGKITPSSINIIMTAHYSSLDHRKTVLWVVVDV